jgi:YaaC-like Protein
VPIEEELKLQRRLAVGRLSKMRFYGVDRQTDRFAVQALRANPPGLAHEADRRRVFGSALEQFDQLLVAAEAVGPATAPIPLFYAFSQGGRAFAAARVTGQDWRPHTHGLSVGDPGTRIGDTVLTPSSGRPGSFQLFCRSIGSSALSAPTTLAAVWAAVGRYRAVEGLGAGEPATTNAMIIGDNAPGHVVLEGAIAEDLPEDSEQQAEVMRERLAAYSPGGEGVRVAPDRWPNQHFPVPRVEVYWERDGQTREASEIVSPRIAGERSGFVLLPALGPERNVLHPVAAMYATWLALSSVARYHPDAWRQALDRDTAATAVAIEEAIDLTLELLPYSFKEMLTG